MTLDYDGLCPKCERPVGDHTIREYAIDCAAASTHDLPFEPVEPFRIPDLDADLAGEVTVRAMAVGTPVGTLPVLEFTFWTPDPAEVLAHKPLRPVALLLDEKGLRRFERLIATSTARAINVARQGRR